MTVPKTHERSELTTGTGCEHIAYVRDNEEYSLQVQKRKSTMECQERGQRYIRQSPQATQKGKSVIQMCPREERTIEQPYTENKRESGNY